MRHIIDKLKELFTIKQEINPDGRYVVYDIKHDDFSPERILHERDYLKKFNPEIMEINGNNRLTIIIDTNFDYNVLSNYVFDQDELSMVDLIKDHTINNKISGYIILS